MLYYNKELTSNTTTYNDQSYVRVGDNTMFGDMKDIAEQPYNFSDSRNLANNHEYNINPVQEVIQEESRTYSDHNSPAKATSTMLTVVNEKYSIFPNDAENKTTEKTEYLGNHFGFGDFLMAIGGTSKSETHSRRYSTYTENSNQLENRNEHGTVVTTYKNWNDYSVATNGKGRLLKYRQKNSSMYNVFRCLLLIILGLTSYNSYCQIDGEIYEKIKEGYDEMLTLYPKNLTAHFPEAKKITTYLNYTHPGAANINSVYMAFIYPEDEARIIEARMKSEALREYHFTDSCLMIVDYDSTLYESADFKLTQCEIFPKGMLPIPNFNFFTESSSSPDFYKDATIYVLGAKKGKYLKKEELWSNKGVGLSCQWQNGYSRGVVISNNIIVYWLEIW